MCVCFSFNFLCPILLWTTRLCDNGSSNPWPLVTAGFCCPDTAGLRGPVSFRPGSSGAARRTASHLEPGQHIPCHPTAVGSHGSRSLLPNSLPPCPSCGHSARRHVPDSHPGCCDSGWWEPFRSWSQLLRPISFSVIEPAAWGESKEDGQGAV